MSSHISNNTRCINYEKTVFTTNLVNSEPYIVYNKLGDQSPIDKIVVHIPKCAPATTYLEPTTDH